MVNGRFGITRKYHQLSAVVAPEIGVIASDRRRVEQVLLNLLGNAIKFTTAGSVTLSATIDNAPRADAPDLSASVLRVSISDTGIGISAPDLATLFQPFRQIDSGSARHSEGTGLGLAISRRLAVLLQGSLTADSELGIGSTFALVLPLVSDPA